MNKLFIYSLFVGLFIFGPIFVSAQTATSSNVNSMLQQIQSLQTQIKAMQDLQNQLNTTQINIQNTLGLIRNLKQGMSGDDVKTLQVILSSDPSVYGGQVTGFFGPLTAQAVKKFQKKNGLDQVGNVGPKTLKKLNEEFSKLGLMFEFSSTTTATSTGWRREGEKDRKLCIKVFAGQEIPSSWKKYDDDEDDEDEDRDYRENRKNKIIPLPCRYDLPVGINGTTTPVLPPQSTTTPALQTFNIAQVSAHAVQNDCYSVVNGFVYNLTSWIAQHPGGASAIIGMCGKDGTTSFMSQHSGQSNPASKLSMYKIGVLTQ